MSIRIQFLGAASNVTGSCTLVDTGKARVLVDCGLFQERDLQSENWSTFPEEALKADAVVLTHAHLDHVGRLPRLARDGSDAPIYATSASLEIAAIILRDAARLQQEDVEFKKRRHEREGRTSPHPYEPLYSVEDAEAAISRFQTVPFEEETEVAPGIRATWRKAGHILGAASVRLRIDDGGKEKVLVFSGDVGRHGVPIIQDPEPFAEADALVLESTYGDRTHEKGRDIDEHLAQVINDTHKRGGNVIIPSFAVERSQELLYRLGELLAEDRIPHTMVVLDSPMAIRVTDVFRRHPDLFDEDSRARLEEGRHPCDFPSLMLSRTVDDSKTINRIRGTAVIIAGSGMLTGGRIKHHLAANIGRPESTLLFVGYQAKGTLGRHLLGKPEEIRLFGETHKVEIAIDQIGGFSGHADAGELVDWASGWERPPARVFLNHGEAEPADALAARLREAIPGAEVVRPELGQAFDL